jgi:hypothetical protein
MMVVSGVRSSCEASAANCRTFCSDSHLAPNACWIRSSIVLMAPASRPASAWSRGSGIRAVRSPRLVIMSAVLAIRSSGARPRMISQRPPTASSASRTAPVISSASTSPRTSLPTALSGRAITRMPAADGTTLSLWSASWALTSRQIAVRAGDPGGAMPNSWPLGFAVLKAVNPPVLARLLRKVSTSAVAAVGVGDKG